MGRALIHYRAEPTHPRLAALHRQTRDLTRVARVGNNHHIEREVSREGAMVQYTRPRMREQFRERGAWVSGCTNSKHGEPYADHARP